MGGTRALLATLFLLLFCGPLTPGSAVEQNTNMSLRSGSASEYGYPSFCMVDEEGRATGFAVELPRAAAKAMGAENIQIHMGKHGENRAETTCRLCIAAAFIDPVPGQFWRLEVLDMFIC
jgi:ABC-type amino acid transport substrate-binding protein